MAGIRARPYSMAYLYVLDTQGEIWDMGSYHHIGQVEPAPDGWIVRAASVGFEPGGLNKVLHIRRAGEGWENASIIGDEKGSTALKLSFEDGYRRMHVFYNVVGTYDPPCRFRPNITFHHALHTDGEMVYEWRDGDYVLVENHYTVLVYVNSGGTLLENWRTYCVD